MTNYTGRAFLLKNGTWSGGTAVADCKSHTLTVNQEAVDITNKSSNGYRTLLEGAGNKSIEVQISGVITTDSAFETFQGYAFAGSINAHALGWADGDTLEASFLITNFAITGEYNGAQTFTATLQSSGTYTFTGA